MCVDGLLVVRTLQVSERSLYYTQCVYYLEAVQRSEDGCDMRRFGSFNHSTCKTVLNLLEAIYLRLRKIVVERVTVVKFRVHNRGSDGSGCFRKQCKNRHNGVHGYENSRT